MKPKPNKCENCKEKERAEAPLGRITMGNRERWLCPKCVSLWGVITGIEAVPRYAEPEAEA